MVHKRIGDLLVDAGVLSRGQLERAYDRLCVEGEGRVASELLRLGLAHERQVGAALSVSAGHPVLVLGESTLDLDALAFVPRVVAEGHRLLPVALDDTTVTVAVADVDSRPIFEQVSFACARRVIRLLCAEQLLEQAIQDAYDRFSDGHRRLRGARSSRDDPHLEVVRTPVRRDDDDGAAFVARVQGSLLGGRPERGHLASTPLEQLGVPVMSTPPTTPWPAVTPPPIGKPVAVVVEDDGGIRRLIARALAHDGFHVLESESGDGGAALLRAHKPDLLVLDAMLPGMHGFELCSRLKRAPGYSDVPVLMISAIYTGWEKAREILEEHRADAFVEKPFNIHYVRKVASELTGRPLSRLPPEGERLAAIRETRDRLERYAASGDLRGALDEVRRWLELDAFDPLAWLEKGNLLSQQRDFEGAMRAYEAAAVYDSRSFAALTNLALSYDRLGFARKASETWHKALTSAPDDDARESIRARLVDAS